jgi:hypothetical protein
MTQTLTPVMQDAGDARPRLPGEKAEWIICLLLTALLVAFHVMRVGYAGAFWRDEVGTLRIAESPSLLQGFSNQCDSAPILTAGLIHVWRWTGFGATPVGLRTFGMLVGLSILAVLWVSSLRMGGRPPLISLSLFALHPVVIQWGDTLRGYGLGTALALAGLLLAWEVVRTPRPRLGVAALMAVVFILEVNCLYMSAFFVFATCVGMGVVCLRSRQWVTLAVTAAAGAVSAGSMLLYLPVLRALNDVHELSALPRALFHPIQNLTESVGAAGVQMPAVWGGILIVGLAFACVVIVRTGSDLMLFATTSMLLSIGGFGLYLWKVGFDANVWYFIPCMGIVAWWLDSLRASAKLIAPRIALYVSLACAFYLVPANLAHAWRQVHERQTNVDQAAALIASHASDGDVVLIAPHYLAPAFARYYPRTDPILSLPPVDIHTPRLDHQFKAVMIREHPIDPVLAQIQQALQAGHRVWATEYFMLSRSDPRMSPMPPAPHAPTGWAANPYVFSWEVQTGWFLRDHARNVEIIALEKESGKGSGVNNRECVQKIGVFEGWKEQ